MADNPDKNEYQYTESSDISSDFAPVENQYDTEKPSATEPPVFHEQLDVKRLVLAVIGVILFAFFAYKLMHWIFGAKTITPTVIDKPTEAPVVSQVVPAPPTTNQEVAAVAPEQPPSNAQVSDMEQKLSQVMYVQDSLRSEISSVKGTVEQLNAVAGNLDLLKNELLMMKQALTEMKQKMEDNAEHMKHLLAAQKMHKVQKVVIPIPPMKYYIQAVVPGRAWLVGENGATLTIRVGSHLAGYGVIRAIDPNLGRIATSSGKIILYSEQDT